MAPVESKAARPAPDFPSADSYYPPEAWRAGQEGVVVITAMHDLQRPNEQVSLAPGDLRSQRVIRQYARSLDAALDESAGITADFLDDVDYLQRSPDIPESERAIFSQVWPETRGALAATFRNLLGATRDVVRVAMERVRTAFEAVKAPPTDRH